MKKILFLLLLLPSFLLAQQQDPGFGQFRNTALTSTAVAIKTSSSNLFGYTLINVNAGPVYVKFYNSTVAGTTVGTTVPKSIIMIPASDGTTPGCVYLAAGSVSYYFFSTALTVAAVTGIADSSTAAPVTPIYAEALYK